MKPFIFFLILAAIIGVFHPADAYTEYDDNYPKPIVKNPKPSEPSYPSAPVEKTEIYGYNTWLPQELDKYFEKVDGGYNNGASSNLKKCQGVTAPMVQKGLYDIRYALGYFDDTQGKEIRWGEYNYGISPSLDIAVFNALRKWLTKPCPNSYRIMCGFNQIGNPDSGLVVLEKMIRLQGSPTRISIRLTHASASESYVLNTQSLQAKQDFLTMQSEDNFFKGLEQADMVIYNGHSRNGGGPDFHPVRLTSALKADYEGYYKVEKPGIKKVLAATPLNPNPGFFLGMFSCFSYRHFYKNIVAANPAQRMVLSSDEINYLQSLLASVGYMEGILQGSCGEELAQYAKKDKEIYDGFKGYQIK